MRLKDEARRIAQRRKLLELEAQIQRATLASTLRTWEHSRALSWAAGAGSMALRLFAAPKLKWMLAAGLLSKLRR